MGFNEISPFLLELVRNKSDKLSRARVEDFLASAPQPCYAGKHGATKVWIKATSTSIYHGAIEFVYNRIDITEKLSGFKVAVFHKGGETLEELTALLVQRLADTYNIDLSDVKAISKLSDGNLLYQVDPNDYRAVGSISAILKLEGSVISNEDIASEKMSRVRNAEVYSAALSFANLTVLESIVPNRDCDFSIVVKALDMETLDPWKVTQKLNPYNLYGAEVVFNGPHLDGRIEPLLLKIKLNPKHCTNIEGTLCLYYGAVS